MRTFIYLQILFSVWTCTSAGVAKDACSQIDMIGRDQWGAKLPKEVSKMDLPVRYVFIHHTAMGDCFNLTSCREQINKVQHLHMVTNGWSDIGYNFLVGEDGRVYEARGWNRTGAHTKYYNRVAVAVSVMGNFMEKIPNEAALNAVHNIINCGVEKGFIVRNYELFGHRDVRTTQCPGDAFYNHIMKWKHFSHNKPTLHIQTKASSAPIYFASLKLMVIGFLVATITVFVNY